MTAPSLNWSAPLSAVSYLTTGLDSLADGSNVLGAAIDVSAIAAPNAYPAMMAVELVLASFTPGATPYALLWRLDTVDGTNYPDGGASVHPAAGAPVWTRGIQTGTGAKRVVFPPFRIYAMDFKLLIGNRTGAGLASSGNTLKYTVFTPTFPTV